MDTGLATTCLDNGEFGRAELLCREILLVAPNDTRCRTILGKALQAAGRIEEAQAEFKAAVKLEPGSADAWLNLADFLQSVGHTLGVRKCLQLALNHVPESLHLNNRLVKVLIEIGDIEAASQQVEKALYLNPNSEVSLCYLGIVRKYQGRIAEAVGAYQRAITINPTHPEIHYNLGDALKDRDLAGAEMAFRAALTLRPDYAEALDSLGICDFFKGNFADALDKFDRALHLKPGFRRAIGHKTNTLFFLGRLHEAWKLYKRRFEVAGVKAPYGRFPTPVWNGEPLAGRALLVWTEAGLGEEVLQASMFPDAERIASTLFVECSPRLRRLFARSFPQTTFIARGNPSRVCPEPPCADFQMSAGDLGGIFRNSPSEFPSHSGYLVPDRDLVIALRERYMKAGDNFVVGLSWASTKSGLGKDKSLNLSEFSPILCQKGIVFVNLQYAALPEEVSTVCEKLGVDIITDSAVNPLGDMDEFAAQVAAMDLVISVSNTTAHIAGALNVPVWNIVPGHNSSGMWHWFSESATCAWYPSMRIFRREENNNANLMKHISTDLCIARDKNVDAQRGGIASGR